jgi:hypothetical protein
MKTEQVKVYNFSELSKEVQEKVIDKHREINIDWNDWYEFEYEGFHEELEKVGLSCESFCFDLYDRSFWMTNPKIEDIKKFLLSPMTDNEKLLNAIEENPVDKDIEQLEENYTFGIEEQRGCNFVYGLEEVGDKHGYDYNGHLKDILKDFLKRLDESYNYLMTDEAIVDTIEANEYEFLENGDRW